MVCVHGVSVCHVCARMCSCVLFPCASMYLPVCLCVHVCRRALSSRVPMSVCQRVSMCPCATCEFACTGVRVSVCHVHVCILVYMCACTLCHVHSHIYTCACEHVLCAFLYTCVHVSMCRVHTCILVYMCARTLCRVHSRIYTCVCSVAPTPASAPPQLSPHQEKGSCWLTLASPAPLFQSLLTSPTARLQPPSSSPCLHTPAPSPGLGDPTPGPTVLAKSPHQPSPVPLTPSSLGRLTPPYPLGLHPWGPLGLLSPPL